MLEEDFLDDVLRDCRNCLAGINENDSHLLRLGIDRLGHHITSFNSILQQTRGESEIGATLQILHQSLESLRVLVSDNLTSNVVNEEIDSSVTVQMDPCLLTELRRQGLPWSKIGALYGLSRQSMYNYRIKNDIVEPNAVITDAELRARVTETAHQYPNAGVGFIHGVVRNSGYRASRKRVWLCLREVDPLGTSRRRRKCISRRAYKVPGANYLWHIDSNHKLIMFRFVVHGCVDGFSRRLIYLNIANNNRANTVLAMFRTGVFHCGLPHRVRADRGSENFGVKSFMEQKSTAQNPFIFGRSVHNTRIERMWRDVNEQVSFVYKAIFRNLEEQGLLDENDELNLFLLSYIFQPRIQESLNTFLAQWNSHCMRSMNNRSPTQIWTVDMLRQGPHKFQTLLEEDAGSIDFNFEVTENNVTVPSFPAADVLDGMLDECRRVVPDPMADDGSHGMNHYVSLLNHFSLTNETDTL